MAERKYTDRRTCLTIVLLALFGFGARRAFAGEIPPELRENLRAFDLFDVRLLPDEVTDRELTVDFQTGEVENLPPLPSLPPPGGQGKELSWETLSPERQKRILERYRAFEELSPSRREMLLRRWREFERLPAKQRKQTLKRWRKWERMSPEERQRFVEKQRRLAEEQERLQEKKREWESVPPEQRNQQLEERRRELGL